MDGRIDSARTWFERQPVNGRHRGSFSYYFDECSGSRMDGISRLSWVHSHVQSVSLSHPTVQNWVEIDNYIGLGG
jgi:hypothetical protein